MKQLTLSVKDRLLLAPALPKTGGRVEMIIVDSLAKAIELSVDEIKEFELKDTAAGGVIGNPAKFKDKIIDLTDEQVMVLKTLPKRLDENKQVTRDILPLLDRIDRL